MTDRQGRVPEVFLGAFAAGTLVVLAAAKMTGIWALTALPVGFLFGFFLEKADLCGASAFSEALMWRDYRKLWGIWVIAATSMLGFALLAWLGWIKLNPKPFFWASYLVGGVIFGVGMVLAGGCVSGSLFKTGQGNLNSMAGLLGIPIGVGAVEYGPLHGIFLSLKGHLLKAADGGPVTISSLTGIPYGVLAVIFAVVTLAVGLFLAGKSAGRKTPPDKKQARKPWQQVFTGSWKPWQAGIAIGILASFAYLSSVAVGKNYPLGVTHGVLHAQLLMTDHPLTYVHIRPPAPSKPAGKAAASAQPRKKVSWWLILEVMGLVLGSFASAKLSGKFKFMPRPPDETVIAFLGGLLVGVGAAFATGCVVGNIMSGLALMSVGNILFALVVLTANWATTYIYLMGGDLSRG